MAKRVQLQRVKGWRIPPNTVKVARGTRWGNPYRIGMWRGYLREDAISDYRHWLRRDFTHRSAEGVFGKPPTEEEIREHLKGKDLACWCPLSRPCHADVLLEICQK